MELGLVELITSLKNELEILHDKSGDKQMFALGPVEIKLKFGVKKELKGDGKIDYLIFAIQADGAYKTENVHEIKLSLTRPLELGEFRFIKGNAATDDDSPR